MRNWSVVKTSFALVVVTISAPQALAAQNPPAECNVYCDKCHELPPSEWLPAEHTFGESVGDCFDCTSEGGDGYGCHRGFGALGTCGGNHDPCESDPPLLIAQNLLESIWTGHVYAVKDRLTTARKVELQGEVSRITLHGACAAAFENVEVPTAWLAGLDVTTSEEEPLPILASPWLPDQIASAQTLPPASELK
jgi:hypothetical protein